MAAANCDAPGVSGPSFSRVLKYLFKWKTRRLCTHACLFVARWPGLVWMESPSPRFDGWSAVSPSRCRWPARDATGISQEHERCWSRAPSATSNARCCTRTDSVQLMAVIISISGQQCAGLWLPLSTNCCRIFIWPAGPCCLLAACIQPERLTQ